MVLYLNFGSFKLASNSVLSLMLSIVLSIVLFKYDKKCYSRVAERRGILFYFFLERENHSGIFQITFSVRSLVVLLSGLGIISLEHQNLNCCNQFFFSLFFVNMCASKNLSVSIKIFTCGIYLV